MTKAKIFKIFLFLSFFGISCNLRAIPYNEAIAGKNYPIGCPIEEAEIDEIYQNILRITTNVLAFIDLCKGNLLFSDLSLLQQIIMYINKKQPQYD